MATEKEANQAREQYSDFLRNVGAHGIAVDKVEGKTKSAFAVIGFFEKSPDQIPDTLSIKVGKKDVDVPVIVRVMEKFKPE